MSATPIDVVLADDHRILREGVRALIEGSVGRPIRVVGEAADGPSALALCERLRPRVLVLDLGLPGLLGLDVAAELRARESPTRTVVLTMHVSSEHVRRAKEQGIGAYLVKGSGVSELAAAIRTVAEGRAGPFPAVDCGKLDQLTGREREVLSLIAAGEQSKAIAAALGISLHTVNTHRVHIMEKLDVHDVASLTRLAIALGLVEAN